MKRTYIIDTNVYLTDFKAIFSYGIHDIVIPIVVLEELDKFKTRGDAVGRNARILIKILDELRGKAQKKKSNLFNGIRIKKGHGLLYVKDVSTDQLPKTFDPESPDNKIIGTALKERNQDPNKKVIVITNDINLRVKCDAVGLLSEDFSPEHVVKTKNELYSGVKELEVSSAIIDFLFEDH